MHYRVEISTPRKLASLRASKQVANPAAARSGNLEGSRPVFKLIMNNTLFPPECQESQNTLAVGAKENNGLPVLPSRNRPRLTDGEHISRQQVSESVSAWSLPWLQMKGPERPGAGAPLGPSQVSPWWGGGIFFFFILRKNEQEKYWREVCILTWRSLRGSLWRCGTFRCERRRLVLIAYFVLA